LTHPFSIYVWKPPVSHTDTGAWIEQLQAFTQAYAIYTANLIHRDSKAVIKVVRYGITLAAFPNPETVERVERQIASQQNQR